MAKNVFVQTVLFIVVFNLIPVYAESEMGVKVEKIDCVSNSLMISGGGITIIGAGIFAGGYAWAKNTKGGPAVFALLAGEFIGCVGLSVFASGLVVKIVSKQKEKKMLSEAKIRVGLNRVDLVVDF